MESNCLHCKKLGHAREMSALWEVSDVIDRQECDYKRKIFGSALRVFRCQQIEEFKS